MIILSLIVPCYNASSYMKRCIDSLIIDNQNVEIIIVNDGSTDGTMEIADEYKAKYPQIIKVINQENRGHGGAIMAGLDVASGIYTKVVDSDDWLDQKSYQTALGIIQALINNCKDVDLFVFNYVYDKVGAQNKRVINYRKTFPQNKCIGWGEVKKFAPGHYILMHSVVYKTEVIRKSGLNLPLHTFYVDNLFVTIPMQYVKTIYYADIELYHYYIGREDQSVNEKIMINRIDQQIKVNKMMLAETDLSSVENEKLRNCLFRYLHIVTIISSILLIKENTLQSIEKRDKLWESIMVKDKVLYRKLKYTALGMLVTMESVVGRKLALLCYKAASRMFGFN